LGWGLDIWHFLDEGLATTGEGLIGLGFFRKRQDDAVNAAAIAIAVARRHARILFLLFVSNSLLTEADIGDPHLLAPLKHPFFAPCNSVYGPWPAIPELAGGRVL
jgi:hypothetical protein